MAQALHSPQRYRGFVLTAAGLQKLHERVKQLETQTRLRQSPRTIAERVQLSEANGIHPITVRKILEGQNGVDRRSIQRVFQVLQLQMEEGDYAHAGLCQQPVAMQPETPTAASAKLPIAAVPLPKHQDWSEAVYGFDLCGRMHELTQLSQAIIVDRCRLVQLLGMAGAGKTALATMLARAVQPEFELIIWKSLHHAPAIQTVLTSVLQPLIQRTGESIESSTPIESMIGLLVEQLQKYRCLVVLDHFNSVLCSKQYAGYYRPGYEVYSKLLQVIAEVPHQSCLMITSREKPRLTGIAAEYFVRSLQLSGLLTLECQQMVNNHYELIGTANEWQSLIEQCNGNPLILKMVAVYVQDYFGGHISDYLQYLGFGQFLFNDLRDLLGQQYDRLSPLEQELVYLLATYQEAVSALQFRKIIPSSISQQYLLEGLDSISRRLLLHYQGTYFTLDPMMKAYVNECLIEQRDHSLPKPKLKIISNHHTIA